MTASSELTYTGLALAVFANQLCLPGPSVLFLMAGGALSAQGQMRASIVVCLGVSACLVADGIWFCLGRRWGSQIMRLLCRFTTDPRRFSQNAHEKFRRYGIPVLSVYKFFPGLDSLMAPLVGAEGASVAAFLTFDTIGGALWSGFYTALGYVFSDELNVAIAWTKRFGAALAIAIGILIAAYACWRGLALLRMIHRLQLRRMSPRMLRRKMKSNNRVAVLDLSNFEEETESESLEAIPGAFRVDPSRLRKYPHVMFPGDVELVLYSSSGGDMLSARVAMALKRIGIDNVWVLEGGLKAWREKGFPVSKSVEAPKAVAGRLGITLPEP